MLIETNSTVKNQCHKSWQDHRHIPCCPIYLAKVDDGAEKVQLSYHTQWSTNLRIRLAWCMMQSSSCFTQISCSKQTGVCILNLRTCRWKINTKRCTIVPVCLCMSLKQQECVTHKAVSHIHFSLEVERRVLTWCESEFPTIVNTQFASTCLQVNLKQALHYQLVIYIPRHGPLHDAAAGTESFRSSKCVHSASWMPCGIDQCHTTQMWPNHVISVRDKMHFRQVDRITLL